MRRTSVLFLQAVIALVAVGSAALLLWEPRLEGVNAHASNVEIYFEDPFLVYAYVASIPLFVGLYQGFTVLGYVRRDAILSPAGVRRLRTIRLCALSMIGFVAGAEIFIRFNDSDDRAGGVFIGVLIAFAAAVVATSMAVLEHTLQQAVDIRSENDFTV